MLSLVVRVSGFAWCENRQYVVYGFLEWEFMSLFLSFDDEYCTHHLVSCRYIQEHRFYDVRCDKDWVVC